MVERGLQEFCVPLRRRCPARNQLRFPALLGMYYDMPMAIDWFSLMQCKWFTTPRPRLFRTRHSISLFLSQLSARCIGCGWGPRWWQSPVGSSIICGEGPPDNQEQPYWLLHEKQTIVLSHGNVEATFVIAASVTLTDINMLYNNYYNNNGKSVRHCIK